MWRLFPRWVNKPGRDAFALEHLFLTFSQSSFQALNIDYSQVAAEQEVDDTKELQVEDALKLYQAALKYHAEGPASAEKAIVAYAELFASEIFKYPEAQTELARAEHFPENESMWIDSFQLGPVQPSVAVTQENGNTLAQLCYLSCKNHGRFLLDLMEWRLQDHVRNVPGTDIPRKQIAANARGPLDAYSQALDKDDTDVELWRSGAAVAHLAGTARIARFCLEAVLDMGEESLDDALGLPNVEQTLAVMKLKEAANKLQDDLTILLGPFPYKRRRRLGEALIKRFESHTSIPKPTFEEVACSELGHKGRTPMRYMMIAAKRDWASAGEIILQQQTLIGSGMVDTGPGVGIGINFPELTEAELAQEAVAAPAAPEGPAPVDELRGTNSVFAGSDQAIEEIAERTPEKAAGPDGAQAADSADAPIADTATIDAKNGEGSSQNGTAKDNNDATAELTTPQMSTSDLPSRKRSTDSAELPEDEGRGRSKRVRNREALDESTIDIAKQNAEWQLNIYRESDEFLFNATDAFLQKLRLPSLIPPLRLKAIINEENPADAELDLRLCDVIRDFYSASTACTPEMTSILINGVNDENIDSFSSVSREAGIGAFLSTPASRGSQACARPFLGPAEGLSQWTEQLNAAWHYPKEAAWSYLSVLLMPGAFPGTTVTDRSSYTMHRWPDELKRCIVQLAVRFDDHIQQLVEEKIDVIGARDLKARSAGSGFSPTQEETNFIEFVETLFELHLDVYSLIKRPGANVDDATKRAQKHRLERWSALANIAINLRAREVEPETDEIAIRHIWATAFHISVCDEVSQAYVIACMKNLKSLLQSADTPIIHLQNNAVIPEISIDAVEQELSKISMKDVIARIFSDRDEDPVECIEILEPLLESTVQVAPYIQAPSVNGTPSKKRNEAAIHEKEHGDAPPQNEDIARTDSAEPGPTPHQQMSLFIANSSWTLRLSLWQRLREAYKAIDYTPKVVSCYLRSIEMLTQEMLNTGLSLEQRKLSVLRCLHLIEGCVRSLITLQDTCNDWNDVVDAEHLRSSIAALTVVAQVLHSFHMFEDQIRVGTLPSPTFEGRPKPSFTTITQWVHKLQLRVWCFLYRLLQDATEQFQEAFEAPMQDRCEYLRTLHYTMGQRKICHEAHRELLRLLMHEMLKLSDVENADIELVQVVYDLYGLKFAPGSQDQLLMDHGCVDYDYMNRAIALKMLGFFMTQAQKVPAKEMPRHEMKTAIDKVQGALGRGKMTDNLLLNGRVYSMYTKGTVSPLDIFSALRGTFNINAKPVTPSEAPVASKGWYLLLGKMALNRFRSSKRLQQGPCEDLHIAGAFFRQDIEYCSENWESWYRLAQVNDLALEEQVSWSAEKLNSNDHQVFHNQRQALHAYVMAASCAVRAGDVGPKATAEIAEMYADFANRIYASSREPFNMNAFGFHTNEERHMSGDTLYQRPPFKPLQLFTAWRLGSVLLLRSIERAPDNWTTHYMRGKCLWKMYTHAFSNESPDLKLRPSKEEVINSFIMAINKLPKRDSKKDPTLEPHYKLISVIHKLVLRNELTKKEGSEIMKNSWYASKMPIFGSEEGEDQSWTEYVLTILKSLRTADKSNWHHRMTARAAHLHYDASPDNPISAMEAKHELTQHMFTKTMVLQVWKPEGERPGRHFVYTTRYVRFFVQLLVQLGDRESLGALVKRLRKKPDQYFEHAKLWVDTCQAYLKVLRRVGNIPEGHEDVVFKALNHEEFTSRSAKLELWCQTLSERGEKSTTHDVLTDVVELKKINHGLMKATLIDDLLGDTYAKLYEDVTAETLNKIPLSVADTKSAEGPQPPKPMSLQNVMNLDGAADPSRSTTEASTTSSSRSRAKGVGRREIQRKAEAATLRSTGMRSGSISQHQPRGDQVVQVVIPSPRGSAPSTGVKRSSTSSGAGSPAATTPNSNSNSKPWPALPFVTRTTPVTSAPQVDKESESSSEESELSELEDEPEEPDPAPPPKSKFPNLARIWSPEKQQQQPVSSTGGFTAAGHSISMPDTSMQVDGEDEADEEEEEGSDDEGGEGDGGEGGEDNGGEGGRVDDGEEENEDEQGTIGDEQPAATETAFVETEVGNTDADGDAQMEG